MPRRKILALTDAQAEFIRRAMQSYVEDFGRTRTDSKHTERITVQLDEATYSAAERADIIAFALGLTKEAR